MDIPSSVRQSLTAFYIGGGGTRQPVQVASLPLSSMAVTTGSVGRVICQVTAPAWPLELPIFLQEGSAPGASVNLITMPLSNGPNI